MTDDFIDIPVVDSVSGSLTVPGSKSLTNRALILCAYTGGTSVLKNALISVDTDVARQCLNQLGVHVNCEKTTFTVIANSKKFKSVSETLYVENAGTMARFLVPALLTGEGAYTLDGNSRMRQRPISDLVEGLRSIGCDIKYMTNKGYLPLKINAGGFPGGHITVSGVNSSQYISALMLAAPAAKKDLTIQIKDGLVSYTYVEMTAQVMRDFGLSVDVSRDKVIIPGGQHVKPQKYTIEADASSASYFFAIAAITQGRVTVNNINRRSIQGDLGMLNVLERMGCTIEYNDNCNCITVIGAPLKAVEINMNTMSDVAPTIAAVALFAEGTTRIFDVENMRIKECDRIAALYTEISKTGADIHEHKGGLTITGNTIKHGAVFNTYNDHRMAMTLSLIGLKIPSVRINDPGCVSKTFPYFFKILFNLINQ